MLKMILTLTALAVSAPAMAQVQPAPHIEWQVQNPFRLFKTETKTSSDANTLAKSRAILASVTSGPSLSASYTAIEKQLRSDRSYQIEPIYLYTAYDRSHDVYEQAYVTPKSERIVANLVNPAPGDTTCTWSMAGGSPPVTQPCSRLLSSALRSTRRASMRRRSSACKRPAPWRPTSPTRSPSTRGICWS
jgi:hypothetical protein